MLPKQPARRAYRRWMLETRQDHGDKFGANPIVCVIMGGYGIFAA